MVAASNELPESEELDALYDRFLVRFSVSQVSAGSLPSLLQLSPGGPDLGTPPITVEEMRSVRADAISAVEVPKQVVDLVISLRSFLQDRCEPPVYVSDRRLVKAMALLKVSAYTCGRTAVNEYDCLLLKHILWQRPEEAERIDDWILERLAQDRGVQQIQYLLAGLFGRACRMDGSEEQSATLAQEAMRLEEVLTQQLASLAGDDEGTMPGVRGHLWLGKADAERAVQSLTPLMKKTRKELSALLEEVVTLQVALSRRTEPHILALLMPRHWADFIRNGPIEEVAPLSA